MFARLPAILLAALLVLVPATSFAANGFDQAAQSSFAKTLKGLNIKGTRHDGITRLAGDSVRGGYAGIQRVQITPSGTIWLLRRTAVDKLFRAGRPGAWQREDGLSNAREMHVWPSGKLVIRTNKTLLERDGAAWTASSKAPGVIQELVLTEEGTAWADIGSELAIYDGAEWTTLTVEELGLTFSLPFEEVRRGILDGGVTGLARTPDGSIWVGAEDRNHRPAGLARYDGEAWEEIHPFGLDRRIAVADVAAGSDGMLWFWVVPEGDTSADYLARWDGTDWVGWRAPQLLSDADGPFIGIDLTVLSDSRLWVRWSGNPRLTLLFDGETWTRLPTYTSESGGTSVTQAPVPAPDGTFWLASYGQGYPQSVYIYDLDEIEPVATAPAVPFDPR